MSTMKVDSIVSSGGTNTAQINGITPALASQGEAEAGTDNTKLMTPLRVKQSITANVSISTAAVLSATAGATAGAVGTYMLAADVGVTPSDTAFGNTRAGSTLTPISVLWGQSNNGGTVSFTGGATQAGTWRAMGEYDFSSSVWRGATLWLRIS